MSLALWLVIAAGGLALLYGAVTVQSVLSLPAGSARMKEIAGRYQDVQHLIMGIARPEPAAFPVVASVASDDGDER